VGEQVGAGGEDLAELDEGGSELFEHEAKADGAGGRAFVFRGNSGFFELKQVKEIESADEFAEAVATEGEDDLPVTAEGAIILIGSKHDKLGV